MEGEGPREERGHGRQEGMEGEGVSEKITQYGILGL